MSRVSAWGLGRARCLSPPLHACVSSLLTYTHPPCSSRQGGPQRQRQRRRFEPRIRGRLPCFARADRGEGAVPGLQGGGAAEGGAAGEKSRADDAGGNHCGADVCVRFTFCCVFPVVCDGGDGDDSLCMCAVWLGWHLSTDRCTDRHARTQRRRRRGRHGHGGSGDGWGHEHQRVRRRLV